MYGTSFRIRVQLLKHREDSKDSPRRERVRERKREREREGGEGLVTEA